MKAIVKLIAAAVFKQLLTLSTKTLKYYIAIAYLKTIENMRTLSLALIGVISIGCIGLLGFTFIHIALFWYLPISLDEKMMFLLILGIIYFFTACVAIYCIHRRASWLKICGVQKMFDDIERT